MPPDEITTQPELTSASEETPAPHLASSEEVWTAVPLDPAVRALTAEEKWPGEWHLIAVMVAHGISQRKIAQELSYTEGRISLILSKPAVQEKIERIRKEESGDIGKRFAAIAPKALTVFEDVVSGRTQAKTETQLEASRWILEKHTGKPKQEVALDGGATIMELLRALDVEKTARTAASRAVTEQDIELKPEPPPDPLADWVAQNVPDGGTHEEGK